MTHDTHDGCGGDGCGCGSRQVSPRAASVNGIVLAGDREPVDDDTLRERAWGELLRQEAVRQHLLPAHVDLQAPALSQGDQAVIEAMLERTVAVPQPTEHECRRYYDARQSEYVEGAQVHARHILFAVTAGVDVQRLARRAEEALLQLTHREAAPARFGELARELSNCPSGADGGDLGWFGPHECTEELARELFHGQNRRTLGLRPRLVHSRYGLHILDVLERRPGRQASFEQVRKRIEAQLAQRSRAKALHRYMQELAAAATVAGFALVESESPLVQ